MILILGAIGRVGCETARVLSRCGAHQIRMLLRDPAKARAFTADRVEILIGEITDIGVLTNAMRNVGTVFVIPPNVVDQALVERRVYESARRAGVDYIVKLSSAKADSRSSCYFFQQHALAENYLMATGVRSTILRSNSFMQNLLWFAKEIRLNRTFSVPMGVANIAPVDVRDVANVAAAVLNR